MTPENLFKDLQSIKNSNDNNLQEFLITALKCGFVEKFNDGNERPCNKDDFSEAKKYHENHIVHLYLIIEDLTNTINTPSPNNYINCNLLPYILINCGENLHNKPWNTEKTVQYCELILQKIVNFFQCTNISELVRICFVLQLGYIN